MNLHIARKKNIKKKQQGIMLLEGLIAILIFSLGILAVVGMQATTIAHASQSKYRLDASFLANKLIGRMWADSNANMASYATGQALFNTWFTPELNAYMPQGRSDAIITVTPFAATPGLTNTGAVTNPIGYNLDIQIRWRAPNEDDALPMHVYRVLTTIVRN